MAEMTSFESLYERHYSRLYTLAFRMTGSRHDAEDVLQTAFLNAYQAYGGFRHESSAYTWLYRIVVNAAGKYRTVMKRMPVDRAARESGKTTGEIYAHVNSYGDTEDEALAGFARETCLQLFMKCMPPAYRVVFTLRVVLQFSVADTADILDMSPGSVKVTLHRARKMIADIMGGKCSLLNPANPCRCSAWVKYALETNRPGILEQIPVIRLEQRQTARKFKGEMDRIEAIAQLYNTRMVPPEYGPFKERIKGMVRDGRLTVLNTRE